VITQENLCIDKDCKKGKALLKIFTVKNKIKQPRDSKMDCKNSY